jgi:hypothetical protein
MSSLQESYGQPQRGVPRTFVEMESQERQGAGMQVGETLERATQRQRTEFEEAFEEGSDEPSLPRERRGGISSSASLGRTSPSPPSPFLPFPTGTPPGGGIVSMRESSLTPGGEEPSVPIEFPLLPGTPPPSAGGPSSPTLFTTPSPDPVTSSSPDSPPGTEQIGAIGLERGQERTREGRSQPGRIASAQGQGARRPGKPEDIPPEQQPFRGSFPLNRPPVPLEGSPPPEPYLNQPGVAEQIQYQYSAGTFPEAATNIPTFDYRQGQYQQNQQNIDQLVRNLLGDSLANFQNYASLFNRLDDFYQQNRDAYSQFMNSLRASDQVPTQILYYILDNFLPYSELITAMGGSQINPENLDQEKWTRNYRYLKSSMLIVLYHYLHRASQQPGTDKDKLAEDLLRLLEFVTTPQTRIGVSYILSSRDDATTQKRDQLIQEARDYLQSGESLDVNPMTGSDELQAFDNRAREQAGYQQANVDQYLNLN